MPGVQPSPVLRHVRQVAAAIASLEQTDGALLDAFAARRDEAAFGVLVKRHGPLVLGVCRRVLGHRQDAEDAFQATFLLLARRATSLRQADSVAGWLHAVACRVAANARRAAVRRRQHEERAKTMQPKTPAWEAAWHEVQALLDEEIRRLPARYREPFVLCCLESRSCAEAARQLHLKEGTVWSRLSAARGRLQQRLARRGVTLSAVLAAAALSGNNAQAHLSPGLAVATVRVCLSLSAGKALADGSVSPQVAALVHGAQNALAGSRTLTVACVLLVQAPGPCHGPGGGAPQHVGAHLRDHRRTLSTGD
jgi:RNA polymerase sigma factor (sigma-70 family)